MAFAGVESHAEDGEQRSSAGVHPGQRHRIDEKKLDSDPQSPLLLGQLARQTKTGVLLHEQNGAVHPAAEGVHVAQR